MTPENKQKLQAAYDKIGGAIFDLVSVQSAWAERDFESYFEPCSRFNEKVTEATKLLQEMIYNEIILPEAKMTKENTKQDSEEIIASHIELAGKVLELLRREMPGDDNAHCAALMLALHASIGIDGIKRLVG